MSQDGTLGAPSHRERRNAELLVQRAEGFLLSDILRAEQARHLDCEAALAEAMSLMRERPLLELEPRLSLLLEARANADERKRYVDQYGCIGVRRFLAAGGERIYLFPVETFPRHINNIYLIAHAGGTILFDTGSGLDSSRRDLALGFAITREIFDESVHFEELGTAVISHAHIDHFGGVNDLLSNSKALLCVHELDARVLSGFEFPQAITPFAGLGHYFHSLEKVRRVDGVRLALGGHEEPISNLRGRIDEIVAFHRKRLNEVLSICAAGHSVSEVSFALFGHQSGYGELLALEEAGAHVEYLHELGKLRIANLNEVASARDPVILYQARS